MECHISFGVTLPHKTPFNTKDGIVNRTIFIGG